MTSKNSSENNGLCVQFSQHIWKNDACKNCSKPRSLHKVSANIPKTGAANTPAVKTPALKAGEKPMKPTKKPSLSKSVLTKQAKSEAAKAVCDPIYDIYDVSAKGQSGKPIDLNEVAKETAEGACLMATPYTVVDVICSSLEKNRQAIAVKPPVVPTLASEHSNDKANSKVADLLASSRSVDEEFSLSEWRQGRLYEEIDDLFMEKVQSAKEAAATAEATVGTDAKDGADGKDSVEIKSKRHTDRGTVEVVAKEGAGATKTESKSGKKSFLRTLLGLSSKSIGSCDKPQGIIIKNNSLSDMLDTHARNDDDVRKKKKLSQGDLLDACHNDEAKEVEMSVSEGTARMCGGQERGESFGSTTVSCTSRDNLHTSSHDLKPTNFSLSSDDLDSVKKTDRSPSTVSNYHSSAQFATMQRPHNRKSMTSAETRSSRRMLLAPPPPPPSTSPSSSSSFSSVTLNRPPSLSKRTLPPDLIGPPTTNKEEAADTKVSLLDGFMADLDAILKKGGVSLDDHQSKSLPRLHPADQFSTLPAKGVETLPLTFDLDSLQQRALPDIPLSTTPLPPSTISPDNDGLYEVLPTIHNNKRPQVQPPALPADKPRPAPRPAIRSVTMTTRQKRRDSKAHAEEQMRVPLNHSLQEQFDKMSLFSHDSLQSLLQLLQHATPPFLPLSCHDDADAGMLEQMDACVDAVKGKDGFLWRGCLFVPLDVLPSVSLVVMVRQATGDEEQAPPPPLPEHQHCNLLRSVASFQRTEDLSEHFPLQTSLLYHFAILPYASICSFGDFTSRFTGHSEATLSNRGIVLFLLQLLDVLLHLQRETGVLKRLRPDEVLVASEAGSVEFFPVLVASEMEETAASGQEICTDLLHLLRTLIACNTATQACLSQPPQQATPKFRSTQTAVDSRYLNCLHKSLCLLEEKASSTSSSSSSSSWKEGEVLRGVLEFSMWGPEGEEEEIRLAYVEPKRRHFFQWWLACARQRSLKQLISQHLPYSKPPPPPSTNNSLAHHLSSTPLCSGEVYQRLRQASFLSRCSVDLLLDSTKLLYF